MSNTPQPNPIDIRAGADQVIAYLQQGQRIQAMQMPCVMSAKRAKP